MAVGTGSEAATGGFSGSTGERNRLASGLSGSR